MLVSVLLSEHIKGLKRYIFMNGDLRIATELALKTVRLHLLPKKKAESETRYVSDTMIWLQFTEAAV